jgi:hypothetical protein
MSLAIVIFNYIESVCFFTLGYFESMYVCFIVDGLLASE